MRTGPDAAADHSNVDIVVDYKASPVEVLAAANKLLLELRMEFIRHETGGDDYAFSLHVMKQ